MTPLLLGDEPIFKVSKGHGESRGLRQKWSISPKGVPVENGKEDEDLRFSGGLILAHAQIKGRIQQRVP